MVNWIILYVVWSYGSQNAPIYLSVCSFFKALAVFQKPQRHSCLFLLRLTLLKLWCLIPSSLYLKTVESCCREMGMLWFFCHGDCIWFMLFSFTCVFNEDFSSSIVNNLIYLIHSRLMIRMCCVPLLEICLYVLLSIVMLYSALLSHVNHILSTPVSWKTFLQMCSCR